MMKLDLKAEVSAIPVRNVSRTARCALGYREMWNLLEKGNVDFTDIVEVIKMNTRNYAKRQMTWFKRETGIIWIDVDKASDNEITKVLKAKVGVL